MTDEEISLYCVYLRQYSDDPAAADLIEQLQRERDEARDRLAGAERYCEQRENLAYDAGHEHGFRAGIEAAADKARIHMLGMSRERSDKMQKAIRALLPPQKAD